MMLFILGPLLSAIIFVVGIASIARAENERRDYLNRWCDRIGEKVHADMNRPYDAHVIARSEHIGRKYLAEQARAMQNSMPLYDGYNALNQCASYGLMQQAHYRGGLFGPPMLPGLF